MTRGQRPPPPLPPREAYRLWAGSYHDETVISALDQHAVSRLSPPPAGRTLLDAGCGTGRRVRSAAGRACRAVGVDLVPEMLMAGRSRDLEGGSDAELIAGDLRAIPLRAGLFDLVWCRLVMGHVPELEAVYAELARVSGEGAGLVVTDFHPAAAAAGHVRSFRDDGGTVRTVLHHVHTEDDHRRAAAAAGWTLAAAEHLAPGVDERPFYERAGRLDDYEAHRDLHLVLALCLTR